jgi:hypothetical protein
MLCLSYYAYVFSSRKLEIRAEQVLPGSEGVWRGNSGGGGGEMTQIMYAHVNKWIIIKKISCEVTSFVHLRRKRQMTSLGHVALPNADSCVLIICSNGRQK